ncbi:MAG: hypothetical protein AAGE96_14230 [Cyanobacteria bacterium P01_G01_bin.19]
MSDLWIHSKFNRRLFLALLFSLLASKTKAISKQVNNTRCDWCWIGAVTDRSITIKAKLNNRVKEGTNYIQVFYHTNEDLSLANQAIKKASANFLRDRVATFELTDLVEDTIYYYVIIADGRRYPSQGTLQFKTIKVHQPYSFAIACSSCAGGTISKYVSYGVSNSKVFDLIGKYRYKTARGQDSPLAMFVHMGDLHYRNDFPFLGLRENYLDDY